MNSKERWNYLSKQVFAPYVLLNIIEHPIHTIMATAISKELLEEQAAQLSATPSRSVQRIVKSIETVEGGGFIVYRPFPTPALNHFDPFLLLDEGGPMEHKPGEAKAMPDHPHRGFETLTYVLEGEMRNWDSTGFSGVFGPGDIEWTTAGSGIIHGGAPTEKMVKNGGRIHLFQLWVNLSKEKKMIPPQSQNVSGKNVPVIRTDTAFIKVIAGNAFGRRGAVMTTTPIFYLHVTLQPDGVLAHIIPEGYNAFAYIIEGTGSFDEAGTTASKRDLVLYNRNADQVVIHNTGDTPLSFILLGGESLNEPVARYGPFVMNTKQEIMQAINDYEAGLFGSVMH